MPGDEIFPPENVRMRFWPPVPGAVMRSAVASPSIFLIATRTPSRCVESKAKKFSSWVGNGVPVTTLAPE